MPDGPSNVEHPVVVSGNGWIITERNPSQQIRVTTDCLVVPSCVAVIQILTTRRPYRVQEAHLTVGEIEAVRDALDRALLASGQREAKTLCPYCKEYDR